MVVVVVASISTGVSGAVVSFGAGVAWHRWRTTVLGRRRYQKRAVLLVGGAVVGTATTVATASGATVPPACTTMTVAAGAAVAPGDGDCATRNRTFT